MNHILLILSLIFIVSCTTTTDTKPEKQLGYNGQTPKVFGFSTTNELLANLKSYPGNVVSVVQGDFGLWTIVQSRDDRSLWSFTPEQHPAHPSVVKRTPVEQDGKIFISTEASCNAEKSICDELIKSFIQINNQIKDSFGA